MCVLCFVICLELVTPVIVNLVLFYQAIDFGPDAGE